MGKHTHKPWIFHYTCKCDLEIEWSNSANSYVPVGHIRANASSSPHYLRPQERRYLLPQHPSLSIIWDGFKCDRCGAHVSDKDADLYINPGKIVAIHKSARICADIQVSKSADPELDLYLKIRAKYGDGEG